MKQKLLILFTLIFSLLLISCNRDRVQAKKSIEGTWNVVAISSQYGEFVQNGFIADTTIAESGELGTFDFAKESVAYTFTRNDTSFTGNESWEISAEKVNNGFTRVTEFTLTLGNAIVYDVFFEDGTKNSEKKANTARFTETPTEVGPGVIIELSLEKM